MSCLLISVRLARSPKFFSANVYTALQSPPGLGGGCGRRAPCPRRRRLMQSGDSSAGIDRRSTESVLVGTRERKYTGISDSDAALTSQSRLDIYTQWIGAERLRQSPDARIHPIRPYSALVKRTTHSRSGRTRSMISWHPMRMRCAEYVGVSTRKVRIACSCPGGRNSSPNLALSRTTPRQTTRSCPRVGVRARRDTFTRSGWTAG